MKIVIDVPEDRYRQIKDLPNAFNSDICKAIRNGTLLPKGHGDLVDADKVILGLVYGKHIDNAKCGEITKIFDNAIVIPADMGGNKG